MKSSIKIKNMTCTLGGNKILSNINLDIFPGEKIFLQGKNGAGKTTLLKILAGELLPNSGEVWINHYQSKKWKEYQKVKKLIGYCRATDQGLYPRLCGEKNIALFSTLLQIENIEKDIDNWRQIDVFNKALSTPYHLCSSGMKRLLTLFISQLHTPTVLLWDEPFAVLDTSTLSQLKKLIDRYYFNTTMIISDHNHKYLFDQYQRSIKIEEGSIDI